jgi:hypothetical protein
MNCVKLLAGSLLLTVCTANVRPAKEWRNIVPLKSTRADVERLLGVAAKEALVEYELPDETIYVEYSTGSCDRDAPEGWPTPPSGWKVPAGTVVAIQAALKKPLPLASLSINVGGFKKVRGDSDVPQHFFYVDEDEGFSIEVFASLDGTDEIVQAYIFGPSVKDKHLRCPDQSATKSP